MEMSDRTGGIIIPPDVLEIRIITTIGIHIALQLGATKLIIPVCVFLPVFLVLARMTFTVSLLHGFYKIVQPMHASFKPIQKVRINLPIVQIAKLVNMLIKKLKEFVKHAMQDFTRQKLGVQTSLIVLNARKVGGYLALPMISVKRVQRANGKM
jgi:hypothetical protein